MYPSIKEVLRLGGPYPQTIRSGFGDYWYSGFHDQSAYSWVGDSLLQAVASPDPPYIEDQCEDMTYRKHYIGQVNETLDDLLKVMKTTILAIK